MSNRENSTNGHIHFGIEHVRITPLTHSELLELEPSDIHELIQKIYDNKPLLQQFHSASSRNIRRVASFPDKSYIPDEQLHVWVKILKWLINKENGWQRLQDRRAENNAHRFGSINMNLHDHKGFPFFMLRMALVGRTFNWETADEVDVREAIRWCNMYVRIIESKLFAVFSDERVIGDLCEYTYLQLHDLSVSLGLFAQRMALAERIMKHPESQAFLAHHPELRLRDGQQLQGLSIERLRQISSELHAMSQAGMLFDSAGRFITKA